MKSSALLLCVVSMFSLVVRAAAEIRVEADFPGGGLELEELDQENRAIRFQPANHKNKGWACWWYFKVSGVPKGETLTLDLGGMNFGKPDRAMFSRDNKTWEHTAPGEKGGQRIVYRHEARGGPVWFAWGVPFVLSDANALVARIAEAGVGAERFVLCESRAGHAVPALRWGAEAGADGNRPGLWIQARQHAWESGSSWVCRGLIEWLASEAPEARRLRESTRIVVVPIMDVDNVERGAGGKNQLPHDHNRDWSDQPVWPEVAAAQKEMLQMNAAGELDLFLDLHNPAPNNKTPFFFGSPDSHLNPKRIENQKRFHKLCLATLGKHPLGLSEKVRISGPGYHPLWRSISKNWVAEHTSAGVVALTLETAWNTPNSTQEQYLEYGAALGRALAEYVR